jgi:2-(1,2-epoxy-1,2-dihydrophenyl)acetyl-CoA isomerase
MTTPSPRFQDIELSHAQGISTLLLNRPASLNACAAGMLAELSAALDELATDENVRAVVLSGKGRLFCAGADLSEESTQGATRQLLDRYLPIFRRITSMEKPVIAAVNGGAAGVGMSLALSCDLVLMAEDAYLLSPFTRIGLVPDGGATWLLVRQLGHARASARWRWVWPTGSPLPMNCCKRRSNGGGRSRKARHSRWRKQRN